MGIDTLLTENADEISNAVGHDAKVVAAHRHVVELQAALDGAMRIRRAVMRRAVRGHVDRRHLAKITGMSRQRVQQIVELPTSPRQRREGVDAS